MFGAGFVFGPRQQAAAEPRAAPTRVDPEMTNIEPTPVADAILPADKPAVGVGPDRQGFRFRRSESGGDFAGEARRNRGGVECFAFAVGDN